jgi:HSP20 family protein
MWNHVSDFDRTFSAFDELRRRFDRVWDDYDAESPVYAAYGAPVWPLVNVIDAGQSLVFRADVPGLTDKDVEITLTPETLTVSGERKATAPGGYSVQRQERPFAKFSRSWSLPFKVDADQTTATIKDGVLTLTLTKAKEAQPRQIAVRAQA